MTETQHTRALVIVASTRAASGDYTDRTGPVLVDWLRSRGLEVDDATVIADADIPTALPELLDDPVLPGF